MKACACIVYFCMIGIIIALSCSKPQEVSGIEITNGNCVGTIYNPDGTAANGAVVRLIPRNFIPFSSPDSLVDSTYTDNNGKFGFVVTRSDLYNIFAQKATASCMDSIDIMSNEKVVVNDTLRESGLISGTVRLHMSDSANSIVILVLGTNLYTTPNGASGKFKTPPLAAGTYTLRMFTSQTGYGVFDTTVSVLKGSETILPDIYLPSNGAPLVTGFITSFDSAAMYATIRWDGADTSKIVSYALRRRDDSGKDTMILLDKTSTSYVDDVVRYEFDKLDYRIAAIGQNYKEGPQSKYQTIVPYAKVQRIKKIQALNADIPVSLFVDRNKNLFEVYPTRINKLDPEGNYLVGYEWYDQTPAEFQSQLNNDDFGHLYVLAQKDTDRFILKFDPNLGTRGKFKIDSTYGLSYSLAVSGEGSVFLIADSLQYIFSRPGIAHHIRVFDSNFVKQNDYYFTDGNHISETIRYGDTIVAWQMSIDSAQGFNRDYHIGFYDDHLSFLSRVTKEYAGSFNAYAASYGGYLFGFSPGPHGLVVLNTNTSIDSIAIDNLMVFTAHDRFLARKKLIMNDRSRIFFDDSGYMYVYSHEDPENALTRTLSKYDVNLLLTAGQH